MNLSELKNNLSDAAKDIKLNLSSVLSETGSPDLTLKEISFIALASAYSTKNKTIINSILGEFELTEVEISAAKAAAIIMAMNNVYYRSTHLANNEELEHLPANLRMNVIHNSGVEKKIFELASLAVSAINGCGKCIAAHTKALIRINTSVLAIQSAIKIAAVINAAALAMDIA